MKRIALLLALTGILMSACKKDPASKEEDKEELPEGKVTPVGQLTGEPAKTAVIGAAGGNITSNDGNIKITIPAGALSGNQTISIQQISNTNPIGKDAAYRLEPHNVQFSKPVSITFNYEQMSTGATVPEAFGIAYQNSKGVWMSVQNKTLDKTTKTITVNTTHFSDWSFFNCFELVAKNTMLSVNESTELQVYADLELMKSEHDEFPVRDELSLVATDYVKEWSLAGGGVLNSAGVKATYRAPSVPSEPNPVAVSVRVDWGEPGAFLLVAHILIMGGEIELRVNDGQWIKYLASPAVKMGNKYMVSNADGDERKQYVHLSWSGGVGTHRYNIFEQGDNNAQYQVNGGNTYSCFYVDANDQIVMSPGGITVTSLNEQDGIIRGTFLLNPAGFGVGHKQTAKIEGRFAVTMGW